MELLPAERNTRINRRHGALTERLLQTHDAGLIFIDSEQPAALEKLPFGMLLRRLHRQAAARGTVHTLSTRVGTNAVPIGIVFVKSTASTFELLTAAARGWKEISPSGPQRVALAAPGMRSQPAKRALEAMLAAVLAGAAAMPVMKSKPAPRPALREITLIDEGANPNVDEALAIDRGNHLARWLTTLPPNVLNSASYRRALGALARSQGWSFTFLDRRALRRLGAGAFLAVSRANAHDDAGIVRLRYRTKRRRGVVPKLTLVGKGICFDTGGINLKPHKSMYQMHEDMQGSAVAVGTLRALTEMRVPYDVDCWLAITENEIGARAFRPQEVVRAANGVTIQVVHSDAEGRMVLADTLALAARDKPSLIVDYATLTGACVMALTERFSGVFTNRPEWHATLEQAGRDSGERVWPFPMEEDFDADLDSTIADILQCTLDSKGDHILAARFLNRFVPAAVPWVHMDLAASNRAGGLAHVPTDFTGFGVRYTVELLRNRELLRTATGERRATGKRAAGKLARVRT